MRNEGERETARDGLGEWQGDKQRHTHMERDRHGGREGGRVRNMKRETG